MGDLSAFPEDGCPFCSAGAGSPLASNEDAIAFPDRFPVSRGHMLVVSKQHVTCFYDLPLAAQMAVWKLVGEVCNSLNVELRPNGFNVALNDGGAAGQTVMHAHIHVIPRSAGDVPDPRGGVRWVIPAKAAYWREDR